MFEIVDANDRVIGTALRSSCHGDPTLIHRAVHVLLFNRANELLLQKRSPDKDIQPGRWDSSVGGHLELGEAYRQAAIREMDEELGVRGIPLTFLYSSQIRNEIESENVETFLARYDGPFEISQQEISEIRFWTQEEIEAQLGSGTFTPNFEEEWGMFLDWCRRYPASDGEGISFCSGDTFPNLFRSVEKQ
jgi:isopentenyl-diphosphate delta-isomerase type 1